MYFANIKIAEKYNYLNSKFKEAYKWLEETDVNSLAPGAYEILGQEVVANVQEYTTMPGETLFFETHDKFFDIQYLASGREAFGVCKRDGLVEKEKNEDNDVIFYQEPAFSGRVILEEGDLIVVAPEDAHKPRCMAGEPCTVKKVVVKVSVKD